MMSHCLPGVLSETGVTFQDDLHDVDRSDAIVARESPLLELPFLYAWGSSILAPMPGSFVILVIGKTR